MDMEITITQWNEEYKKLSNLFKNEENNLIKSFLQEDFSLFKVYQNLIKTDYEKEKSNYQVVEKQLKNYINESFSYLKGKNATRINNFDFQNKIRKIDELFHKIKKEQKTKYDNLLIEESSLEKEINNYIQNFEQLFKEEKKEIKTKKIPKTNSKILSNQKPDKQNSNLELIHKYINNIMNNIGIIDNEINELSFNELEKIIEKLDSNDIIEVKELIEKITNIIEKDFGGINIGWQPKEHEEFLKLRTSYNNNINNYEFLTALCNLIPYIPSSEHKNHIRLFEKYIQLKEIKNILIKKYKDLKEEINEETKTLFFERKNFSKKIPSDLDNLNLKKKMMIKEWKEKKTMEKKTSLAKQKKDEKLQKEKERNLYLLNKEKNEILINKYKEKKEAEKKIVKDKNNNEKYKNILNQIDFDRIKKRENTLLEKKKKALRVQSSKNLRIENNNFIKNQLNYSSKRQKSKSRVMNTKDGLNNLNINFYMTTQEKGRNYNTDTNQIIKYKSKDFS